MTEVLLANSAIFMTWALLIPALTGIGLLLQRACGVEELDGQSVLAAFWMGFAIALGVGQVWHFFAAADGRVWALLVPLGIAGLGLNRRGLWRWARRRQRGWPALLLLLLAALALRVSVGGTLAPGIYDTGLYHLPSVLWNHAHPLVPGIANLHGRLGFNSSLFVYAATLNEGPWAGRPHHVVQGMLLLMTSALAVVGAGRVWASREASAPDLAAACMIAPALFLIRHPQNFASGMSPNLVTYLMVLISGWLAMAALTGRERASGQTRQLALGAVLTVAAATTVKLTVAPFAAAIWLLMAWWTAGRDGSWAARLRPVAGLVLAAALLIGPWMVRGVIQSGYPMYPVNVAGVDVEWRVPDEQVRMEALWSRSSAQRSRSRPAEGFEWVGKWARWTWYITPLPLILLLAGGVLVLAMTARRGWPRELRRQRRAQLTALPVALALGVWFLSAPDERFGGGLLWLLAVLTCTSALSLLWIRWTQALKLAVLAGVLTLGALEASRTGFLLSKAAALAARRPPSTALMRGLAPLPEPEMRTYTSEHGLRLQVPVQGNQVWGAPLLSSPHPSPGLRQRDPEDISLGFVHDGAWQPYGFPHPNSPFRDYVEQELSNRAGEPRGAGQNL